LAAEAEASEEEGETTAAEAEEVPVAVEAGSE
jgi:hypothetical protein